MNFFTYRLFIFFFFIVIYVYCLNFECLNIFNMVKIIGYCLKHRGKIEIKDPKFELNKIGRAIARGTCPQDGTKMYKLLTTIETPDDLKAKMVGLKARKPKAPVSRKSRVGAADDDGMVDDGMVDGGMVDGGMVDGGMVDGGARKRSRKPKKSPKSSKSRKSKKSPKSRKSKSRKSKSRKSGSKKTPKSHKSKSRKSKKSRSRK